VAVQNFSVFFPENVSFLEIYQNFPIKTDSPVAGLLFSRISCPPNALTVSIWEYSPSTRFNVSLIVYTTTKQNLETEKSSNGKGGWVITVGGWGKIGEIRQTGPHVSEKLSGWRYGDWSVDLWQNLRCFSFWYMFEILDFIRNSTYILIFFCSRV